MSFIFADPICGYTVITDATRRGWQISGPSLGAGRFGLQSFRNANSANLIRKAFPAVSGRIFVQFAIWVDPHSAASKIFQIFNNSGANVCMELGISAADALQVYDANGTVVATTSGGSVAVSRWNTIAIEAEIGSASGILKVWLNQPSSVATPVVNLSSIDLDDGALAGADMVGWFIQAVSTAPNYYLSEVLIYDSSGAAPWNAYLGDKRQHVLLPNGAGSSTTWTQTPGSGSNFDKLDDPISALPDDDATYVQGAAGAGADLYAYGNLPAGTVGIVGVVLEADMKKTDAGAISPLLRMRENATNVDSAALSPSTTYGKYQHFSADVPGGSGWSEAEVNALEAGQVV